MEHIFNFVLFSVNQVFSFTMQHIIPILIFMGASGFLIYLVGETIRKKGVVKAVEGQASDFPYKPVALCLNILGVAVMIVVAVLLYFAGGYDPLLAKLGW